MNTLTREKRPGGQTEALPKSLGGGDNTSVALSADLEHDQTIWRAGYNAGLADGCQHVHPAIADSVARMFAGRSA